MSTTYGDVYPLTPCIIDPEAWLAYQLLPLHEQEGALVAFRRAESPVTAMTFQLHGLEPASHYTFEDVDSGEMSQALGNDLMTRGLPAIAHTPRSSRLLFYRRESDEA